MCLALLAWQASSAYPLVLAANRDEVYQRPSAQLAPWQQASKMPDWPQPLCPLFGGRDLQAQGAWQLADTQGRWGILTNYRHPDERLKTYAVSRGHILPFWVGQAIEARDFNQWLQRHASEFAGFNLLWGDRQQAFWFSNRAASTQVHPLDPGVYVLSNALLDTPWPKVQRLHTLALPLLAKLLLNQAPNPAAWWQLLNDRRRPADQALPDTQVGLVWERHLSSIFVHAGMPSNLDETVTTYGTRASSLFWHTQAQGYFAERTYDVNAQIEAEKILAWHLRA
ncbi:Uncharacterized conserved protein, contains NRDE domain [Allopseudospirillum japonicum]|uniref:Uncharacterized conserved protein, contains NRDE domain n=1 Tax=Allopseudospirillum japonicum TaxID=64971 RepID=A0A1H6SXC3_9GAMM|nr:NRDE family protein [Allopseudospirillum japonicum]SEI72411.1 Uncharacterized conserved protein, contains NRDE domain [Allopseudospirillum japonicum]